MDIDALIEAVAIGDMLAFADTGIISRVIRWAAGPPSHVAAVYSRGAAPHGGAPDVWLTEPAMQNYGAISTSSLRARYAEYRKSGAWLWWFHLSDGSLARFDIEAYQYYHFAQLGKPYNFWGAIGSAFKIIAVRESRQSLFCSDNVARGYEAGDVLPPLESAEVTPRDLTQVAIWGHAEQLTGGFMPLTRVNRIPTWQFKAAVLND